MRLFARVSKKWLLDYVRLEEDEDTAELLLKSSFLYVGKADKDGVEHLYYSYPTPSDVAWVSFTPSENALGTEAEEDVPQSIKDATAPREKHPTRKITARPDIPADRSPIPSPAWIPQKYAPSLFFFPMYEDTVPMAYAAKAFSARTKRADVGIELWVQYFCIKLTSGRYAIIESHEDRKQQISIELEVTSTQVDYPHGYVYTDDLKEILNVLGREIRLPLKECQYQWRE